MWFDDSKMYTFGNIWICLTVFQCWPFYSPFSVTDKECMHVIDDLLHRLGATSLKRRTVRIKDAQLPVIGWEIFKEIMTTLSVFCNKGLIIFSLPWFRNLTPVLENRRSGRVGSTLPLHPIIYISLLSRLMATWMLNFLPRTTANEYIICMTCCAIWTLSKPWG